MDSTIKGSRVSAPVKGFKARTLAETLAEYTLMGDRRAVKSIRMEAYLY